MSREPGFWLAALPCVKGVQYLTLRPYAVIATRHSHHFLIIRQAVDPGILHPRTAPR